MTLFPKTIDYKEVSFTKVKGEAVKSEAAKTFRGSVQPVTGKDVETLEVGREDRGKVKVYSSTQLKVGIAGTNYSGDVVIWKGQEWEIIQEMINQNDIINHYKYIAEFRGNV